MTPKQIREIHRNRQAVAPYNFVELPDQVVPAPKLPETNSYDSKRHTGKITCTLTTASPLYIRCGLTQAEFEQKLEAKNLPDFFYTDLANKQPVIPGSSLRGMLRTLLEIISFSKIDRVSDFQRFFFRAVAADKHDPLERVYKDAMKEHDRSLVKAGYLARSGETWVIYPAKPIQGEPFAWVRKNLAQQQFPELASFDQSSDDRPQHIKISFGTANKDKYKRLVVQEVGEPEAYPMNQGMLVTSGNMKQDNNSNTPSTRQYHCIIGARSNQAPLTINDEAIQHYRIALTEFQQQPPFDEAWGVLVESYPVFYCPPKAGQSTVTLFGHSPNFRIPYSHAGNGKAASVGDFIPAHLTEQGNPALIDFADALFGYVRQAKQNNQAQQARAGRVFVTDAICTDSENPWLSDEVTIPQILASPKPTTFQHYLVQTSDPKIELKHYGSQPGQETVIRGHKLYWHKGKNPSIDHPDPAETNETQLTRIKPIKPGAKFQFTLYFENLTDVELGALQWILDVAKQDKYRLSLGMGKPLGMGAVKIDYQLYISDRKSRYAKLFDANGSWATGESLDADPDYVNLFKNYMLEQLRLSGEFNQIDRIRMLLAMLSWKETLTPNELNQRRYLEIERQGRSLDNDPNEYKTRRVLPTPLQVLDPAGPVSSPPSAAPAPSPSSQPPARFKTGDEVDATIVDLKTEPVQGKNKTKTIVAYEVEGERLLKKQEFFKEVSWQLGDTVRLRITELKDGRIKKYELL